MITQLRQGPPAGAAELIADLELVHRRTKEADKELPDVLAATGTTLMHLHGIGPTGAARLLVEVGDILRFPNRAHFASWDGIAPIDASAGDQVHPPPVVPGGQPADQPGTAHHGHRAAAPEHRPPTGVACKPAETRAPTNPTVRWWLVSSARSTGPGRPSRRGRLNGSPRGCGSHRCTPCRAESATSSISVPAAGVPDQREEVRKLRRRELPGQVAVEGDAAPAGSVVQVQGHRGRKPRGTGAAELR